MKQSQKAEKILKQNPTIIASLLKEKKISKTTEKVLLAFVEYGYFSPATTGGYGLSDELSEVICNQSKN